MESIDHEALDRALEIEKRNPERSWQLAKKMETESWHDVAAFAAFCCQARELTLKPYELPPCAVDADDSGPALNGRLADESVPAARALLQRMLAAGLSRYEPNPIAALEKAEAQTQ